MRIEEYQKKAQRTAPDLGQYWKAHSRLADPNMMKLLHSILGLQDEIGELVGPLKKHLFYGAEMDETNLVEEFGDASWFIAEGVEGLGQRLTDVLKANVRKLEERFPDKFTEDKAKNRNLDNEYEALQGGELLTTNKENQSKGLV